MNYLIGSIIGLIGFFVFFNLSKKRIMKKIKSTKKFLDVLVIDAKAKMSREIFSGTPSSEIPTDLEVVMKRYYPKLPPYNKMFNFSVHKLIEKVDWTIDPKEFFLEEDKE